MNNLNINLSKSLLIKLCFLSVIFFFAIGLPAMAQQNVNDGQNLPSRPEEEERLKNPLDSAGINDIPTLIQKILEVVITIGVPVVVLFIIYSGFLFVKAQGNPTELEKAKATLKWVLIGAAILLGAWVLASAIQGTVDSIRQATVG